LVGTIVTSLFIGWYNSYQSDYWLVQ